MAGRTAIVIAHRLSTVRAMDRLIVLDDGAVVEDGTHDELLAAGGTYAGLWRTQSGGFLGEADGEADGDGSGHGDGEASGDGDGEEAAARGRLVIPR